ncbi:MAG: DNA polymerase III subunit gamma/tau, partial [Chloroflexi bacterium]|nr:DNA polymerase III subunit gamma/tau [Chloroflexota bacterium]
MTSQALYRKWRPRTFSEVVGQEHVTRTLRNALASGRIVHAYLFSGPRGTGKTSTARILAKAVNCLAAEGVERPDNTCALCRSIDEGRCMDLIEMDAATHTGVDDVRDLLERIHFAPSEARYKVYIIDEVHRASANAFDALLKTLEEPPPHTLFVLATTEIHKVPPTILSRCQRFDFRPIPTRRIVEHLRSLVEAEGLQAEPEALELMARQATGSVRDAVSLLDQVASYGERRISLDQVQAILGTVAPEVVERLVQGLAQGDVSQGLTLIQEAIAEGADPRQLAREVVEYLRGVLLVKSAGRSPGHVAEETSAQMARLGGEFSTQRLAASIRAFSRAS